MEVRGLGFEGAAVLTSRCFSDGRGSFHEAYTESAVASLHGRPFTVRQANYSVSRRGAIRGVHVTAVPAGQAKYVMCAAGRLLDVVVDLRVGSPSFGRWVSVPLTAGEPRAVYVGEGLGHAICALTDGATALYLCSEPYRPAAELRINPLDADLTIDWQLDGTEPLLAETDATAPSLADACRDGRLPTLAACRELRTPSTGPDRRRRPS